MGNTPIIEIKHDRIPEIERNPEGFVEGILEQCHDMEHTEEWLPGGEVVIAGFSQDSKEDKLWEKFKADLKELNS